MLDGFVEYGGNEGKIRVFGGVRGVVFWEGMDDEMRGEMMEVNPGEFRETTQSAQIVADAFLGGILLNGF
ncbi:hypothetical protein, partial [Neisseria sicca]|uniref:hypothetical protein n=1 Tax=Neisseria sicca TaxID=490 RepID=UPI0011BCF623